MRSPTSQTRAGDVLAATVLLVIVLALLGGIAWWLFSSRARSEAATRQFAKEAARTLAVQLDQKFLDVHLGPEAQLRYPPSFRERLLARLRDLGRPTADITLTGDVTFTSSFFQPRGQFRARIDYPATHADLDLAVSNPQMYWQIDYLNLTWSPPEPAPQPEVAATPTGTP